MCETMHSLPTHILFVVCSCLLFFASIVFCYREEYGKMLDETPPIEHATLKKILLTKKKLPKVEIKKKRNVTKMYCW